MNVPASVSLCGRQGRAGIRRGNGRSAACSGTAAEPPTRAAARVHYASEAVTLPQDPPRAASYRQNQFPSFPGATDVLLIRHGESEAYVDGTPFPLVDGHGDPALSAEGAQQAQRLAARLAGAGIGAIYVTTLRRTVQTAAPLARALGLAPRVEPDLREVHLGEWEGGRYRKMVAERHPTVLRAWQEERWDVIPGAEPADAFAARVRAAVERLAQAHPGQRVAVFTHGGVIGQVLAAAAGSRPFAFITSDNASISRLVLADGRWLIRGFNDTAHLGPDRDPPGGD
jgi:2,3-bisphosphoglycerate-dependent phosphoglycerate mutase